MKFAPSVILLLGLTIIVYCKLEISNFEQLGPLFEDEQLKNIPYSIANFGSVPFGKTVVAHLQQTPGFNDACDLNQYTGAILPLILKNSFLLMPRGGCPFVTKTLHAQQLGAAMAIVMDNLPDSNNITMFDNGEGNKVKIPCILINFKMGEKLRAILNRTSAQVLLKIKFQDL